MLRSGAGLSEAVIKKERWDFNGQKLWGLLFFYIALLVTNPEAVHAGVLNNAVVGTYVVKDRCWNEEESEYVYQFLFDTSFVHAEVGERVFVPERKGFVFSSHSVPLKECEIISFVKTIEKATQKIHTEPAPVLKSDVFVSLFLAFYDASRKPKPKSMYGSPRVDFAKSFSFFEGCFHSPVEVRGAVEHRENAVVFEARFFDSVFKLTVTHNDQESFDVEVLNLTNRHIKEFTVIRPSVAQNEFERAQPSCHEVDLSSGSPSEVSHVSIESPFDRDLLNTPAYVSDADEELDGERLGQNSRGQSVILTERHALLSSWHSGGEIRPATPSAPGFCCGCLHCVVQGLLRKK